MNRILLDSLRQETQTLHAQLDTHPMLRALLADNFSISYYAQALSVLYEPQKILEVTVIKRLNDYFPDHYYSARYPFIAQDLKSLGHIIPKQSMVFDDIENADQLLGVLYVLEGAKLGAKKIMRYLEGKGCPFSFFQSGNDNNMSGWSGFLHLAECSSLNPAVVTEMAVKSFNCYLKALRCADMRVNP